MKIITRSYTEYYKDEAEGKWYFRILKDAKFIKIGKYSDGRNKYARLDEEFNIIPNEEYYQVRTLITKELVMRKVKL